MTSSTPDDKQEVQIGHRLRAPAQVLGCVSQNTIAVIVLPGSGMAYGGFIVQLSIEVVPPDLRMPNTEFDVVLDRNSRTDFKVLRRNEPDED